MLLICNGESFVEYYCFCMKGVHGAHERVGQFLLAALEEQATKIQRQMQRRRVRAGGGAACPTAKALVHTCN
jgi:hypothetical protein